MARKRLCAPICVAGGHLSQSSFRRNHALLRPQLLQELFSMLVPRSPSLVEIFDPCAFTEAANEALVQEYFLEHPQVQATDLVAVVRRRVENVGSEGVFGD